MDASFWFWIVNCTYLGVSGYNDKNTLFFCLKIFFTFKKLKTQVDPEEMQHYAAFNLGLHCLGVSHIQRFNNLPTSADC